MHEEICKREEAACAAEEDEGLIKPTVLPRALPEKIFSQDAKIDIFQASETAMYTPCVVFAHIARHLGSPATDVKGTR